MENFLLENPNANVHRFNGVGQICLVSADDMHSIFGNFRFAFSRISENFVQDTPVFNAKKGVGT